VKTAIKVFAILAAIVGFLWLVKKLLIPKIGNNVRDFYCPRVGKDFYLPRVSKDFYLPRRR